MKCDEQKLFLYSEGLCSEEENNEIKDHLSRCSRCLKKYERMKFAIDCFTSYYQSGERGTCPSAEEVVGFQEGEMDARQSGRIKRHIDKCQKCTDEILLLDKGDAQQNLPAAHLIHPPPLSQDVLNGIADLKKSNLRGRMENVLRALVDKGKEALTSEKINEAIDKYLFLYPDPLPVHAMPSVSAETDTELVLNDAMMFDISVAMGEYSLSMVTVDDTLIVKVMRKDLGVSDVEVVFITNNFTEMKTTTGKDGIGVLAGIEQGPYRISIRVPDDHDK